MSVTMEQLKVVKSFEEITQAAKQAQQAAQNINASGGTAGSRVVAAKAAPSGSQSQMTNQDYTSARGSAGLTGASARDFAAQSQGLGGLVRLYATYAANVFAVSAAFNALSTAMDTTNMVSGLNQLGAASGVALGTLSKNLVKATDGAISLREAMTATAQASSSGMNSDQILRMGVVAKQASQALGVDMSDAISRISRGITKLEPELLDELGLFTKTGKAAEEYAKSVGKSVNELTDFERRASFANAVLAEGEAKFSSIKLDVNPYTALLANIKDLAQVSLEFINKGLAPIIGYLNNSPTALGIAIAGIGAILVKQALPALGEFKAGLASAADSATQLSVQKAQDASKARLAIDANMLSKVEAMADDKVAAVDAAEQKIQALEASGLSKKSAAYKLLQKDIADVTQADIDGVEQRARAAESVGDTKRAALYRETTAAVIEHKKAEEDLVTTRQTLSKQLEKDAQGMTVYGMTVQAAEKAQSAATKANILSNAAYNGSLIGVSGSLALMRSEMLAAGIATNTLSGKLMLARGALVAFGGAAGTVMAALNPVLLIITAVSFAFSLLDGAMSGNSKESASFSDSLDKLDTSTKHLGDTLDVINKKPFLERLSPQALKVKATALSEVALSISSTVDGLLKADKAATGWDRFFDGYKTVWGGDILSKAAKGLVTGITESLTKLAGSPEAMALSKELSGILQIDVETASFEEIESAIKKLGRESPDALKLIQDSFKKITSEAQVTAAKGTELLDSFKKLSDIKQTLDNKFLPTDDVTKFGQELISTSKKLSIALDDPQQRLNAIIALADNALNIPGATFEQITQLTKAADLAKDIQFTETQQLQNKQKLVEKEKELVTLLKGNSSKAKDVVEGRLPTYLAGLDFKDEQKLIKLKEDLKDLKSQGDINIKVKTELVNKLDAYSKEVEVINLNTFKAGADLVAKQISAEFLKAGKVLTDAYTNVIGQTEGTIRLRANADKALITAQIEVIKSQRDLTIATRENSLRMQEKNLLEQINTGRTNPESAGYVDTPVSELAKVRQNLRDVEAAKKGDFSKMGLGSSNERYLKDVNEEGLKFANNMRASAAQMANLRAQITAIDVNSLDSVTKKLFEPVKKDLQDREKSLSLAKQQLDVEGKLTSQGNMAFVTAKQALETQQLSVQEETSMLAIKVETARQNNILSKESKATPAQKAEANNRLLELQQDKENLEAQFKMQKATLASTQLQERLSQAEIKSQETKKLQAENYGVLLTRQGQQLTQEQKLFDLYSAQAGLAEVDKANQKFLLEQKKAELDYEEKTAKLKVSSNKQFDDLLSKETALIEQAELTGSTPGIMEELNDIGKKRKELIASTKEEATAAARLRDNTIGIAKAVKETTLTTLGVALAEEPIQRELESSEILLARKREQLTQQQKSFDLYSATGRLAEVDKANLKFLLENKKAELDYEEKLLSIKKSDSNKQLDDLDAKEIALIKQAELTGLTAATAEEFDRIDKKRKVLIARVNEETAAAARLRDTTIDTAKAVKETTLTTLGVEVAEESIKRELENSEVMLAVKKELLAQDQKSFDLYSSMGGLAETDKANQKFSLDQRKAELDYEEKLLSIKKSDSNKQLDELGATETALIKQAELTGLTAATLEELDRIDKKRKVLIARVKEEAAAAARLRDTTIDTAKAVQTGALTAAAVGLVEQAIKREIETNEILLAKKGEELTQQQKLLDLYSSIGVITDREKIKRKFSLEQKKAELDYEEKIAKLKKSDSNQQLDALGVRETGLMSQAERTGLTPAILEEFDRIAKQRKVLVDRVNEEAAGAARVRDNTIDTAKTLATVASIEEARKREAENYGVTLARKGEELAQEQRLFDLRKSTGVISETEKIRQQFLLDQKRIELDYEEKIANQRNSASNQQLDALGKAETATFAKLGTEGSDTVQILEDLAAMAEQRAVLISRVNQEADGAARLRDNTLGIAIATKEAALEQEKYNQRFNQLLENSQRLGESLANVFGDLGTKVGALVDTLVNVGIQNEKNNILLAKNAAEQKKLNDIDDPLGLSAENQEKLNGLKDEEIKLNKKKVNDELAGNIKTVSGAKNLFKEKTFAYKALDRIEKAMHLYRLAMDAKELAVKLGNMIVGTTAKAGAETAETGLTFGGAIARLPAYAAEIYGKTIGQLGPIFGPAVATALVASMFSMFGKGGGKSAPAFSMNSEQIQETMGTGTTYNSKGEKVADVGGILGDDTAKANSIANSLEILKDNSFESLDYDNKLLGSFQNVAAAISKTTNTVLTSGLRNINPELSASLGSKVSGGGIIDSIFGGKSSQNRSINSQRLELSGTFADVANGIGTGLRQVTDVLVTWTKKGGWFSKDKSGSYVESLVGEVPEDINKSFQDIFKSFKQGYQDIAEMMGMGDDNALTFVTDRLDTVELKTKTGEPLKFDYTGLKGDEVKAELEAYFSKINNIALKALFPEFSAFETAGEDYGTTVVRVLQNTKQVELALVSIGSASASAMQGLSGFTAADDLVKISGGIQAFVDSTKFFASNFLTEAERAVPVQAAVVKQLADLGYANIDTKEEFKSLIQTFKLTDAASRKTYTSLLELAPGFTETLKAIEDSFAETKSKLKETSTAFSDFAKNIKTFREGLVLGAQSIATPTEKFAQAKTQFDALYASALGGDKDAMGKLTGSASTLLDLGKTLFASGSEYTSLFNSISTSLAEAEVSSLASADVADLQLKALDSSVSILTSIDTNIAQLVGVPAKAAGGLARGMTLVGEMGPELVDFSYPGRVYTADQTAGMFSPVNSALPTAEIVNELRQLKQELAQLRKDQQKQTGDLIISNYDAHSKSSEEIATAIVTTGEDTMWTERSKSEIK